MPKIPDDIGELFDIQNLKQVSRRDQNVREIRSRSRAIFLGDNTVLCRALGRYKMYIEASDVGFGSHLMLDGFWEFGTTEFIARHIAQGMTALDLGANFGYYSLMMAELIGPSGKLIAFEPNPVANNFLSRSISINGLFSRTTIDNRAIWDSSGQILNFSVPANEPKNARISVTSEGEARSAMLQVSTIALDDLGLKRVDFIKADIEGAEQRLWAGMQQLLANNPDVILLLEFACGRCIEPRTTLEQMQQFSPLRYLDDHSTVHPITIEQVLSRAEDWMLVLSRRPILD